MGRLGAGKPLDALPAQRLANHATAVHHSHALQIRTKCPLGCLHGETTIVTESRLLTTVFTLSHKLASFFIGNSQMGAGNLTTGKDHCPSNFLTYWRLR
jgi:hypothetical protein